MHGRHANFLVQPDDVKVFGSGQGHARHNHPDAEEIIFIVSDAGEQMVADERGEPIRRPVSPGCTVQALRARYPSTRNTGGEPMQLFVVYTPAGPEGALHSRSAARPSIQADPA